MRGPAALALNHVAAASLGFTVPGFASKVPHYYEFFQGGRRPDLNAAWTSAVLSRDTLYLTGVMQGPVNTRPTSEGQESYFVWGVNRGGAATPGTAFPNRPGVVFDAVVVVSVETEGVSASVRTLGPGGGVTALPASSVFVSGRTVSVAVPVGALPSTGFTPDQYRVNLWPRSALPDPTRTVLQNAATVASFVPENGTLPVLTVGRFL